jgi:hypothetical protein
MTGAGVEALGIPRAEELDCGRDRQLVNDKRNDK